MPTRACSPRESIPWRSPARLTERAREEIIRRDSRHSHARDPTGRIVDFRLCERARRARLVPNGASRVRPRRRAVRQLRPADPQDPGGAARNPLLPALPEEVTLPAEQLPAAAEPFSVHNIQHGVCPSNRDFRLLERLRARPFWAQSAFTGNHPSLNRLSPGRPRRRSQPSLRPRST